MRDGSFVSAGEHGGGLRRTDGVLQSHTDRRPSPPSRASANRVYDHHDGAAGCEKTIDLLRCSRLFDAEAGQVGSHGSNEIFWVCHVHILTAIINLL